MLETLSDKLSDAFKGLRGKASLSEDNIEETLKQIRTALLEADVNFKVVKEFTQKVKEKSLGEKVIRGVDPGQQFIKIMHDELARLMGAVEGKEEGSVEDLHKLPDIFEVNHFLPILIVGLNGAGKTTFSGKLGFLLQKKKKKVYLIPADNFRPAAKDQLITLAKQVGLDYFDSDLSETPEVIVRKGLAEAKRLDKQYVIIDTAGRLHVDEELMGVLKRVKVAVTEEARHVETILVADAMTGQEALNVAKTFDDAVKLSGAVLSKMDSDARGGAALSIRYVTGIPLLFFSTGEKLKDLEVFHPDRMAKRLLDMGDVLSLVEKAEEAIDQKEAEKMMKKLEQNRFTINDFLSQMEAINKLGSFQSIMKMIPGMGDAMKQVGDLSGAETEMKRVKVIISSMTNQEKEDCELLTKNKSRMLRIAKGSGTTETQVQEFLKKFIQMRSMMSGMMKMMKGGGMPNMGAGMPGMGGMPGGFPGMPQMGPQKGFRAAPGTQSDPMQQLKKKKKGPWGKSFF